MSTQKIMQNPARTTKLVLSDGQIPREKFDDSVTSGDAHFFNDAKNGAEKNAAYFLDCESDPEDLKYFPGEIAAGKFHLTDDYEIEDNKKIYYEPKPIFYTKPIAGSDRESDSDSSSDSDSDALPSLKHMNLGDDEIELQVDRLTFYKHQQNVTRKTWTVVRPEPKRLAYVPFLAHPKIKSNLAHISTKLLFVKQPYFEHSIYLSFLTIQNESDDFTSYMVKCSNPKKLRVQPSMGFIKPRDSVKVSFSTDRTFAYEFYELLYESVTVYVAPFKIMESDENKILMMGNQSPATASGIGLLHIEDFWRSYGTPWFPKAEIHYIKKFIPSDPSFYERSIIKDLKALKRDVCARISGWFKRGSPDKSYFSKGEELIRQSQVEYNLSKHHHSRIIHLESAMMNIKRMYEGDRMIWKLCKLVLCSVGLFMLVYYEDTQLRLVFGFREPPEQSIWSWSWWSSLFQNWNFKKKCNAFILKMSSFQSK